MIPALLAQFYRSDGGKWVLLGFLASATALLLVSWCLVLLPGLPWRGRSLGVPVKDYLAQSGIFVICAFVLLHYALELRTRRRYLAMALVILAVMFVASVGYIATSRTSMAVFAVLLLLLGMWHFGWKGIFGALAVLSLTAALLWSSSSYFRSQILGTMEGAERVVTSNISISTGFRLGVWTKSMELIGQAPLIGHGTGTIPHLFRLDSEDKAPARAAATDNPHNQIFVVGIQLGLLGACLLIAMWIAHLMLFRSKGSLQWIGIVIVAQNIISSAFNSHLSDFTQGWLYVLGTGVVGGMVLRQGRSSATARRDES
jgi:O-antigen ligase